MTTFGDRLYELGGQAVGDPYPGGTVYVNAESSTVSSDATSFGNGSDSNDGLSWASAYLTMSKALSNVKTLGRVCFVGDVREELVGDNELYDVTIQGCGSLHHPDNNTASVVHPGASMWRAPSAETGTTPLLELRGRGWKFVNIIFDAPSDAACVLLQRTAEGANEYDASHATFDGCRFLSGEHGIEDNGGANNITIKNCEFAGMTAAAIYGLSTSIANPRVWKVFDNIFPSHVSGALGNVTHMDLSLNESLIKGNMFGLVVSTAKYLDFTGGNDNIITKNFLGGEYDTSNYVTGTGDYWAGNTPSGDYGTSDKGTTVDAPTSAT